MDYININQKIYIQVFTDITASTQILSWFEQINQPPVSNQTTWWQCQTLLIEGFTNIVEHAHKNLPIETPIELEVTRFNRCIEIRIFSYGEAFALKQQLEVISDLDKNFNKRGRGLRIMFAIADKLSYELQADNRYCFFISKKI